MLAPTTPDPEVDVPTLTIRVTSPTDDDVRELLERHLDFANANSPFEHVHALDVEGLLDPAVTFFGARREGRLVGVGALRELTADHAELKSMHTLASARGTGVGRAMVEHLLAVATGRGYRRVSLETGTGPAFEPAHALYRGLGFEPCEPFADYTTNDFSTCMTLVLTGDGDLGTRDGP